MSSNDKVSESEGVSQLRHVAIIMDGNNRWARENNKRGIVGHQTGAERLYNILEACEDHNIEVLTVFAFSSENWRRPKTEVTALMSLFSASLRRYRSELKQKGVSLKVIGRRDRFSARIQKQILDVEEHTQGQPRTLVVAADYGGRWDIVEAAKTIASKVRSGELFVDDIDEKQFDAETCLSGLPEVDLLIRTGSETRISNFLLWQLSYSELFFADCYWPDFDTDWLDKAVSVFYQRQRRFGENPDGHHVPKALKSAGHLSGSKAKERSC